MATIMVVEDEPNQRLLYQMEMEEVGYRVVLASSGREALQKVEEERPDLIVLDLRLPGMDGIELLGRILRVNNRIPVIIYSAYERFKENFMSWAADAYLVKSSNVDVLKGEVQRVLCERKAKGIWPIWPKEE